MDDGELWERAYTIRSSWPSTRATRALERLLSDCRQASEAGQAEHLLLAYLAYHLPCDATATIEVESELNAALAHDPSNVTARLYLGHHYFDEGNYAAALTQLSQVDDEAYIAAGQHWRALKIQELLLAARSYINPAELQLGDVRELVHRYAHYEPEDLPVPVELVRALAANARELSSSWGSGQLQEIAVRLRTLVDKSAGPEILDQEFSTIMQADCNTRAEEKERRQAYAEILQWGLLALRESAQAGNLRLCEIEADHLHNLPSLLEEPNESRHQFYINQERALYLDRLRQLGDAEYLAERERLYGRPWKTLAVIAGDQGHSHPKTDSPSG